ncbi:MAG: ATP synthase F1 subunit epsilon [Planctomycetaceae bacterium]|nr:ATP synthase F1 subunit epsilon [Planctomycetaceae bacterium]
MKCIVVTPEATILDVEAAFVALPLYDGEIGIGENHTPLVGRLGYGELRINSDKETTSYCVEGGFVEVMNNTVSLLTNWAVPSDSLDLDESRTELESALQKVATTEDQLNLKAQNVAAARARVRLAEKFAATR